MTNSMETGFGREDDQKETQRQETENLTPKELAENLSSSPFNDLKQKAEAGKFSQGSDWAVAKSEAYLKKIKEGNFHDGIEIEGTYDGEQRKSNEPSVYEYFKEIADTAEKRMGAFKEDPKLVEKFRREGEGAQRVVEAIESTEKGKEEKSKSQKRKLFIGAKKNPDGTIDYSTAGEWDGSHTERQSENTEEKENNPEFQKGVNSILEKLDELGSLLDPKSFKPEVGLLRQHLNKNITGITAERRALGEVSPEEIAIIAHKAQEIENKMKDALEIAEARGKIETERLKGRTRFEGIDEEAVGWLSNEGPKVMQSLMNLHTLKSGKIKNRSQKSK